MIDTLAVSERLQKAGLKKTVADEQAQIWREVAETHLVTKKDLDHAVEALEMRLKNFMLTLVGTASTAIVAVLAAIKYFG